MKAFLYAPLQIIQNVTEIGVPIVTFYMSERKARQ